MSQRSVLVIDDSATIRRLVDTTLGPVGYSVLMAATAEEGVQLAEQARPDVIVLDHQLPGTTGVVVCQQLLARDSLKDIPIIASSTLRKKAYIEYADCPNVVDMLPKPYTGELLITTVANVLDTASMVVDSQREGTAVPEVIQAVGEVTLSGEFSSFSLRAVLDFLNNANQSGALEIEDGARRVWVYVGRGRVQALTATGVDTDRLIDELPESLQDLGPVLRLTVGGGSCSQVEGLVQLLDNKVLDPRLLQKLLRYQAAVILRECFQEAELNTFRFETDRRAPALHSRLPLDTSVVALLVEGYTATSAEAPPLFSDQQMFSRRAIRGQNLDRAGLNARHQRLLALLNDPISLLEMVDKLDWAAGEVSRVLQALVLADLVEVKTVTAGPTVVVLDPDPRMTLQLRQLAGSSDCPFTLKVVRDRLSFQLVLRRQPPDIAVLAFDYEIGRQVVSEFSEALDDVKVLGIGSVVSPGDTSCQAKISRPYRVDDLFSLIQQLYAETSPAELTPSV